MNIPFAIFTGQFIAWRSTAFASCVSTCAHACVIHFDAFFTRHLLLALVGGAFANSVINDAEENVKQAYGPNRLACPLVSVLLQFLLDVPWD